LITCLYKKTFLKDLSKLHPSNRRRIEKLVFDEIPNLSSIFAGSDIKKMKGYEDFYRIRMGDYRIGIKVEHSRKIRFYRVKSRDDIYKVFP
jgi:mRNA interferase RelE/StbE